MREPLYLDEIPEFEKVGAAVQLSDNEEEWRRQILDHVIKTLPYLEKYQVTVNIDREDPEAGHGVGNVEVEPKEIPDAAGAKTQGILIPIIIRSRRLQPLDTFLMKDRAFPLTEERVDRALFRPEAFALSKRKKEPRGYLSEAFTPASGWRKWNKVAGILPALAETFLEADKAQIKTAVTQDEFLARALKVSQPFGLAVAGVVHNQTPDIQKVASQLLNQFGAKDVVQFSKTDRPEGKYRYNIKMACANPFSYSSTMVSTEDFVKVASEDVVQRVDQEGHVTVTTEPATRTDLAAVKIVQVDDFGEWRVRTIDGRDLIGWVIPSLMDFDGNTHGMCLFTNGSENCIQEQIAGSMVGKGTNLPEHQPAAKDQGVFYTVRNGNVIATIPVGIMGLTDQGYVGEDLHNRPFTIRRQRGEFEEGLRGIAKVSEGQYLLPEDFKFMRIGGTGISLVKEPEAIPVEKTKLAYVSPGMEILHVAGDQYEINLKNSGLEKFAEGMGGVRWSAAGVEFWGALIGCDIGEIQKTAKLARDRRHERTLVLGNRKLVEANNEEILQKTAALLKPAMACRRDLLKEAAAVAMGFEKMGQSEAAEDSVDAMMSIGLITPENIQTMREYLPALEDTASKLATALISVRMGGIKEIPEGALEKSIQYLDESISGIERATQNPSF